MQRKRGCLGRVLLIIGAIVLLIVVLGVLGMFFEGRAVQRVAADYPPPGEVIEISGRNMHYLCMGEGAPTVILDAGQGGWSSGWADIMPTISQQTRVCAYDRAGYGWSDPADDQRTPQDAANDLASLLAAAEIAPPYILVGFSHAGLADRIFAAQYANHMAGLVLIDPATEFDNEILGPELLARQRSSAGMFSGFGLAAHLGILRAIGTENMAASAPFIAVDAVNPEVYYTFVAGAQWWATSTQEFLSHLDDDNLAMVRELGPIQEDVPLVIIGSGYVADPSDTTFDAIQDARQQVLQDLAGQSFQGQYIFLADSSHNVLDDRPDAVIEAIETMQMAAGS